MVIGEAGPELFPPLIWPRTPRGWPHLLSRQIIASSALSYIRIVPLPRREGNRTTGQEKTEEYQDEIQAVAALEDIARAMRQRGYEDLRRPTGE